MHETYMRTKANICIKIEEEEEREENKKKNKEEFGYCIPK